MSYDVYINDWDANYTSNVCGMWDEAMPELNLRDMDGKAVHECIPHLSEGVQFMMTNLERMRSTEPENGWGNAIGATRFLFAIWVQSNQSDPQTRIRVSY